MKITKLNACLLAVLASVGLAQSVSAQERLPWGAIKAGNADGTIPAWTGGLPANTAPTGFKKDSGYWADPYAADKPLYTITAKNMAQYESKLADGIKEMLKRYPTFRLDVYPTRRPANYSSFVVENTQKNAAGRCKLIENGEALSGCFGGFPFPVPKTGNEVMWNLILTPRGFSNWTYGQVWYVDAAGNRVQTGELNNRTQVPYYDPKLTPEQFYAEPANAAYFIASNVQTAPSRVAGEGNLVRRMVNPVAAPDKTWIYNPGQRRVRLTPDAGYDFPVVTSAGTMFWDEINMFSGKMDRFDFKYLGVKEIIIPYNGYAWEKGKADKMMMKGHADPDFMRWELHRVHVVEATRKPGARHVMSKRRFYMDEDIPHASIVEGYDNNNAIVKVNFQTAIWAYDKQVVLQSGANYHDLATGAWYIPALPGTYKGSFVETDTVPAAFYTPDGLARRTQR